MKNTKKKQEAHAGRREKRMKDIEGGGNPSPFSKGEPWKRETMKRKKGRPKREGEDRDG